MGEQGAGHGDFPSDPTMFVDLADPAAMQAIEHALRSHHLSQFPAP
jgi:hypothetical protein